MVSTSVEARWSPTWKSEGHVFGNNSRSPVARRSFLSRFGAGMTMLGATVAAGESTAEAQAAGTGSWQPVRHAQDDWLDQVPGRHRFVFDTTSPAGFGAALLYANNFFLANQSGYGLGNGDAAVVIVARHNSTQFAYTDAIWAKYGTPIARAADFEDPKTRQRPVINVFNAPGYGALLPSLGTTLDALVTRGVHFAVCQMATRRVAGVVAEATGGAADAVYNELVASLIPNSHMVPAGIVAVNRAQERGYTFAQGG
jgi:intracellular sulfur oxidation DsrE/DsrF family protein